MKRKMQLICLAVITWLSLFAGLPAYAGPYTDALSNCITVSTTPEDRITFVKWMFSAMSRHPAVKNLANVSDAQLIDASRQVAAMYMRLMTVACKDKAQEAVKHEGKNAVSTGFQVLGQIAAQELFANPEVAKIMSSLDTYIDKKKLHAAIGVD